MYGHEQFLEECVGMGNDGLEHVHTAYVFAKYGHRNQMRDCGTIRYFEHPRDVALIIIRELGLSSDWQLIVTALLHDILEDSRLLSKHRLFVNFGDIVAHWIELLSKEKGVDYYARLSSCGIWQVFLVKLADRLHNVRSLNGTSPEKQKKYRDETRALYLPLCDKLELLAPAAYTHCAPYLREEIKKCL